MSNITNVADRHIQYCTVQGILQSSVVLKLNVCGGVIDVPTRLPIKVMPVPHSAQYNDRDCCVH